MSEKIILKKQKLINLRKSLNMTQADFAKKAHISRTTYQSCLLRCIGLLNVFPFF